MSFVTTNIRLETGAYKQLKLRSAQMRRSLAQLIREAVERTYQLPEPRGRGGHRARDPLFRVVGICRTGIRDGSVEHDRDIYDSPRA